MAYTNLLHTIQTANRPMRRDTVFVFGSKLLRYSFELPGGNCTEVCGLADVQPKRNSFAGVDEAFRRLFFNKCISTAASLHSGSYREKFTSPGRVCVRSVSQLHASRSRPTEVLMVETNSKE